jgi:hypothetical protein
MKPTYVPILNAKKGEFDALSNMPTVVMEKVIPFFELPRFTNNIRASRAYENEKYPTIKFVTDRLDKIHSVRGNQPVMFDLFKWAPNSTLENGEHILSYTYNYLTLKGTPTIPVIGYDRWEDVEYSKALESLSENTSSFCLRLESYAFDDMLDEDHFNEQIDGIIETFGLLPSQCCVLLDFNEVSKTSIVDIQTKLETSLKLLDKYGFDYFFIAGCSLTQVINDMVPDTDSTGKVLRREMIAWQAIRKAFPNYKFVFGDYGVVNPNIPDDMIAPDANGKIRYTIKDHYFVVRGHSRRRGNKGEQMRDLSRIVVNSPYFMGQNFSWGDQKIAHCSLSIGGVGNPTNWVSYDTSHHVHAVLSEIFEFERALITSSKNSTVKSK